MSEEPAAGASRASPADPNADCPRCLKPQALCVCEGIAPIDNKVSLLILQHPQEQDRALGTARLTVLHFKDALLKIGLSWPSLTRIFGRPADPQRWAILYLGSVKAAAVLPDRDIVVVNKKGTAVDHQDSALSEIEGVVVLDGTWSQAKALWWRNGWMLKCKRIVLGPSVRRATAGCGASRAATGSRPSKQPRCCWRGSKGSRRSRRHCTRASSVCSRAIARCIRLPARGTGGEGGGINALLARSISTIIATRARS